MPTQYDEVAVDYARLIAPKYRPIAELVARRLPPQVAGCVVELAVGTGLLTTLLAPRVAPGSRYVGVDVSPGMLAVAREVVPAHVELAVSDVRDLPLADSTADLAVSSLGPVQDSVEALTEVRRVLKPGGRLALVTWDEGYAEMALLDRVRARLGVEPYPTGVVVGARQRLAATGFTRVQVERVHLDVTHDSVTDYVAYRAAFGALPWLDPARQPEARAALREEARRYCDRHGRVRLDWRVAVMRATARP